jgi:MFS transporter, FHS family, glucose/mannose:H+ symporter
VAFRRSLGGFVLSGIIFSALGALLPAWSYHLRDTYATVGNYFLFIALGAILGAGIAPHLLSRWSSSVVLAGGCALASVALLFLGFFPPPFANWWRYGGVLGFGLSGGVINTALFYNIDQVYRRAPAAALNVAGLLYGLGSLVTAALVAGTFYAYSVTVIFALLALFPALLAVYFFRSRFDSGFVHPGVSFHQVLRDFQSPAAILFALLLFFQFGNEYAVAGWLALYLIQKLGISPAASLWLLTVYWLVLLLGRVLAQYALARWKHSWLLSSGFVAALLGCTILMNTNNMFGAVTGILMVGGGFTVTYPLVVEQIGDRFSYYHPVLFNSIFSVALLGGMLAPWSMGIFADLWGIRVVMLLPLFGSIASFLLLLLIRIEAGLLGPKSLRKAKKS